MVAVFSRLSELRGPVYLGPVFPFSFFALETELSRSEKNMKKRWRATEPSKKGQNIDRKTRIVSNVSFFTCYMSPVRKQKAGMAGFSAVIGISVK